MHDQGMTYFNGKNRTKDLAKARQMFEAASSSGDLRAKNMLGYMLLQGLGGPKNEALAFTLLEQAARANIVTAQINFGHMHEKGIATPRDLDTAISWYQKAASQNSLDGHLKLIDIFYFGSDDLQPDYIKALPHVKAAAIMNHPGSQNIYGTMLEFGQATQPDPPSALHWYREAALQNDAKAQSNLGRMLRSSAKQDTQIAEAYAWIKISADQGEITARVINADFEKSLSPSQKRLSNEKIADLQKTIAKNPKANP
jgi:TPR repeat protein